MAKEDKTRSSLELVPIVAVMPEPLDSPAAGAIGIKRDGSFMMAIRVFPVDFNMRVRPEQEQILADFGDMLDSLPIDFPIQIYCHNKKLDTEAYFRQFETRLRSQDTSILIRRLIEDHMANFSQQILQNTMVQKEFYMIIPYKPRQSATLERASDNLPFGTLFRLLQENSERKTIQEPSPEDLEMVRMEMESRANQVQYYLDRMGCENYRVPEDELRRLFYELFHPGLSEYQKILRPQRGTLLMGADMENIRRRRKENAAGNIQEPAPKKSSRLSPQKDAERYRQKWRIIRQASKSKQKLLR